VKRHEKYKKAQIEGWLQATLKCNVGRNANIRVRQKMLRQGGRSTQAAIISGKMFHVKLFVFFLGKEQTKNRL